VTSIGFDVAADLLSPLLGDTLLRRTLGEPSGDDCVSPRGVALPREGGERAAFLRDLDSLPEVIEAAVGRSVGRGPFWCVLHKWDAEARVELRDRGFVYVCDCVDGRPFERGPTEVYVTRLTGHPRKRSLSEYVRWHVRLAIEAGVLEAPPVYLPPLPSPTRVALKVYEGLRLFVQVRELTDPPGESFTFARSFAAEWCDVSPDGARAGTEAMRAAGILQEVGEEPSVACPNGHLAWAYVVGRRGRMSH
jgi:hypothetical protein